jgi:phage-related protein
MAISRMQQPRQMYGLGSLVKSITKGVKGAVKGVVDVAKSPLGLAALGIGVAGLWWYGTIKYN